MVKKANEVVDAVRRRVTHVERGRRGRKSDVEWRGRRRLLRGSERLTDEQRRTLFETLTSADPQGDIAAVGGPSLHAVLGGGSPKNSFGMCWPAPTVAV